VSWITSEAANVIAITYAKRAPRYQAIHMRNGSHAKHMETTMTIILSDKELDEVSGACDPVTL